MPLSSASPTRLRLTDPTPSASPPEARLAAARLVEALFDAQLRSVSVGLSATRFERDELRERCFDLDPRDLAAQYVFALIFERGQLIALIAPKCQWESEGRLASWSHPIARLMPEGASEPYDAGHWALPGFEELNDTPALFHELRGRGFFWDPDLQNHCDQRFDARVGPILVSAIEALALDAGLGDAPAASAPPSRRL